MAYTQEQIVTKISGYMKKRGGPYGAWYVGMGNKPKIRLFKDHGVQKKGEPWIYIHAESEDVAQKAQSYFLKTLGTTGGEDKEGDEASFVFAYKKKIHAKS